MPDQTPEEKALADAEAKVQARIDEATAGLKAKNTELIGKNQSLTARAKVIGDRTPEDVQADLELAAKFKEDKAKAAGDFDVLKSQLLEQHKVALGKAEGRGKKVEGKLYDVMARREAEAAIVAAGGNPKVLLPHILPFIKVEEQDEDFVSKVVDAKGNQRIAADGTGTGMTIAQLVESFKADETFGVAFSANGSNGSGARNETTTRNTGAVVIPKNATPQEYRRMKADAEKRGVPYTIGQ